MPTSSSCLLTVLCRWKTWRFSLLLRKKLFSFSTPWAFPSKHNMRSYQTTGSFPCMGRWAPGSQRRFTTPPVDLSCWVHLLSQLGHTCPVCIWLWADSRAYMKPSFRWTGDHLPREGWKARALFCERAVGEENQDPKEWGPLLQTAACDRDGWLLDPGQLAGQVLLTDHCPSWPSPAPARTQCGKGLGA